MKTNKNTDSISKSNKMIRRQRVIRYFIDAAKDLAAEGGMESVTIRSVSEQAGYNSATLYNYFDSFEQLLAFTSIDLMREWLVDLSKVFGKYGNAMDEYLTGWYSCCYHAFQNPAGYAYTYCSPNPDATIKYFEEYRKAFPDILKDVPDELLEMCIQKTLKTQEESVLMRCVDAGFISAEDVESIYKFSLILFRGFLTLAQETENTGNYLEYTEEYMEYFYTYVKSKLKNKGYEPKIPKDLILHQ